MRTMAVMVVLIVAALLGTAGLASAKTDPGSFADCPKLSEGRSTGPCVERLQNALNTVDETYHLKVDGVFGPQTRIAVLDFQGRNKLGADGLVGPETARELQRQALAKGSVATPGPGRKLTPEERCRTLGTGWIVYQGTRCIRDGVVGQGLSPRECAKEALGLKAFEEAVRNGASEKVARALATKAAERAGTVAEVVHVGKCVFWDTDDKELQVYRSVPMP